MRVVGLMSGTSYDAVDAAVLDFALDGDVLRAVDHGLLSIPIPPDVRADIAAVLPPAPTTMEAVCRLDTMLGRLFGTAAAQAIRELGGRADLIASHGQTVYHWVSDGAALGTLQLGAPGWIAAATGVPVVSDFRTADIALGGQGAPLVPMLDDLLILEPGRGALNLGGIANISVRENGRLIGYDIGPANALIDAAVVKITGGAERFDTDGARAARGTVDAAALDSLLAERYYAQKPPKSTGKELFTPSYAVFPDLAPDGLIATLTELTAVLVARACRDHELAELVVSGGGIRNPTLLGRIRELSAPTAITLVDEFGISAQAKEACAFALLGFLTVHGLPGTVDGATGASRPAILGSITPGAGPLRLPPPVTTPPRRLIITR
jgi:anhydro-N-acetylmuramic acid kinase